MAERGPIRGVLAEDELLRVQSQFAVAAGQVVRDHVISHGLAAIAAVAQDDVIFFGGTALSRTLLPDLRLSEDIDLIALGNRQDIGSRIQGEITRRFQRTLGAATFTPGLGRAPHPQPSVLDVRGTRIQVQLIAGEGYPRWPTQLVDITQRYSDAPPARLRVLTPPAFVASKLAAWQSRHASRDLYDLWALAERDMIDQEAARLYGRYGQFTSVQRVSFAELPTSAAWEAELAHQGIVAATPEHAARVVSKAIAALPTHGDAWSGRTEA